MQVDDAGLPKPQEKGYSSCYALRKALPAFPPHLPMVTFTSAQMTASKRQELVAFFREGDIGPLAAGRGRLVAELCKLETPGQAGGSG